MVNFREAIACAVALLWAALYSCNDKSYTHRQGPSGSVQINKNAAFSPDGLPSRVCQADGLRRRIVGISLHLLLAAGVARLTSLEPPAITVLTSQS